MIEIDGSHEEGGGSILRQSLILSALTGKPFRIINIRKNRSKPGLAPQHLAAIELLKRLCDARTEGVTLGSSVVSFEPGKFNGGNIDFDVRTAGSVSLLAQTVMIPAAFCEKKTTITLTGGTDVAWSPPFDYLKYVFAPQLNRYCNAKLTLLSRGYYPKGGGVAKIEIKSLMKYPDIMLTKRGKLLQIRGVCHSSHDLSDERTCERCVESATLSLSQKGIPVSVRCEYSNAKSSGFGITLWAVYGEEEIDMQNPIILGADELGNAHDSPERAGQEAARKLLAAIDSEAACDLHLTDQIIPLIAWKGGILKSQEITRHCLANIRVSEIFTGRKITVKDKFIECQC